MARSKTTTVTAWCSHCNDDAPSSWDRDDGFICCLNCGKVIDQVLKDIYYAGPTFEKTAGRQSSTPGTNDEKIVSDAGDSDTEDNESTITSGGMEDADEPATYQDAEYAGEDNIDYYGNRDEGYSYDEESDSEY